MNKFMKGVRRMPIIWQIWLGILMLVNGIGPLFFLSENVAVVTLVAVMTGGIIGSILTEVQGFTKLLGVMHAPWMPMLALQLLVIANEKPTGTFAVWLYASTAVTFISLAIDVADVTSYLRGNKKDLLNEKERTT
jgi:hypothetical protein